MQRGPTGAGSERSGRERSGSERSGSETLVSGSERPSAVERWRALPARRRRALEAWARGGLLAAAACLAAGGAVVAVAEGEARSRVALTAVLDVTASSSAAGGGRVDYDLVVRSAGPRPVLLRGAALQAGGLRAGTAVADALPARLAPGGEVRVALVVDVDCAAGVDATARVRARVRTEDGVRRTVGVRATGTQALLDAATTYCAVVPDGRTRLSGTVARSG